MRSHRHHHPLAAHFSLLLAVLLLIGGPVSAKSPDADGAVSSPHKPFDAFFWPEFRGPNRDGTATGAGSPPVQWSETSNIVWRIDREQQGWSSPVVANGIAWMTEAPADGKTMSAFAIDLASGTVLWERLLFENEDVDAVSETHALNGYASPTPVTDGEHLWVTFGSYGTACLEASTGEVIWQRRDLPCNHFRGPGSSPVLIDDQLILHYDGFDFQYVVAFDAKTGEINWKVDRDIDYGTDNGDYMKAYGTPIVIEVDGADQLISPAAKAVLAYRPETGEEIWRVTYSEHSVSGQPAYDGETVYINTGWGNAQLMAIDPTGKGDVTGTHVRWSERRGIGKKPSQLLVDDLIFNVHDDGIASCIDAKDGSTHWSQRLRGKFSASPLLAGGHIYLFDHDGTSYVLKASKEYTLVAENQLDDGCMASPVPLGDHLLVRTRTAIYLIGS